MNSGLWLPSYLVHERTSPPPTTIVGVRGRMRWQIIDARGRVVREAEHEQDNIVVNAGLNDWFSSQTTLSTLTNHAAVGTQASPTAPAVTDIALQNQLGSRTTSNGGQTDVFQADETVSTAHIARLIRTREFPAAQVGAQNLTEWAFFRNSAGAPMWSRELFRDGVGTPITLTPNADQGLRLVYTLEVTYDETTQVLLNQTYWGNADVKVEWCWNKNGSSAASFAQLAFFNSQFAAWFTGNTAGAGIHDAAITPAPTYAGTKPGSPIVHTSLSDAAYTTDSFQRDRTLTWDTSVANAGPYAHLSLCIANFAGRPLEWYRFTRSTETIKGITAKTNLQEYRFTFRRKVVRT